MVLTFSSVGCSPSMSILYQKKLTEELKNSHFLSLALMLCFSNLCKTSGKISLTDLVVIRILSKYQTTFFTPDNTLPVTDWNMAGALETPKFNLSILNKSLCVLMVNTFLASYSNSNCWHALDKSNLLK